jgi:hypothetical protein
MPRVQCSGNRAMSDDAFPFAFSLVPGRYRPLHEQIDTPLGDWPELEARVEPGRDVLSPASRMLAFTRLATFQFCTQDARIIPGNAVLAHACARRAFARSPRQQPVLQDGESCAHSRIRNHIIRCVPPTDTLCRLPTLDEVLHQEELSCENF